MNGETYNDATWFLDASPAYRRRRSAFTWWRRKARIKRMTWRHCIFWPIVAIIAGLYWSAGSTILILCGLAPFAILVAFRAGRRTFFMPLVEGHSDGSGSQRWLLKPKYRRMIESIRRPVDKRRRPGEAAPSELGRRVRVKDIPPEHIGAVRAEISGDFEQPPVKMKLLMAPDDE